MTSAESRLALGIRGEKAAAAYLRSRGFVILRRSYRCARGEIDLVCRDGDYLVFVEVKTRSSLRAGHPEEAITTAKRRRLLRVAQQFLAEHQLDRVPVRFDVVAIRLHGGFDTSKPHITHYPHAFGADLL